MEILVCVSVSTIGIGGNKLYRIIEGG